MFAVFVVDVLCVLYPQPRVAQVRRSVDDFQLQLQLSLPGPEDWTRADGGATNFNESIELRCCWRRARLPFSSIQRSVKSRTWSLPSDIVPARVQGLGWRRSSSLSFKSRADGAPRSLP